MSLDSAKGTGLSGVYHLYQHSIKRLRLEDEELRTLVQVWKRGRAAARAWQHDWRDGSWKQAHQGSTPEIKKIIIGTFLVNHHPWALSS